MRTSLSVGTLCSQSACFPLSFSALMMYFPSGEMAANVALTVLVTCVIAKFWNGAVPPRFSNEV